MTEASVFLPVTEFNRLIEALEQQEFACYGPQQRDGVIVYDPFSDIDQLPQGYQDQQSPGFYRLNQTGTRRYFAWANGPQALKPLVFAPRESLWRAVRSGDGQIQFNELSPKPQALAVFGVRSCDLNALALQDQHFLEQDFADPWYRQRRERLFLVAVNCSHPAETCFCASTGDGPDCSGGYDLMLDELDDGFVVQAGSLRARLLLDELGLCVASAQHIREAQYQRQQAVARQETVEMHTLRGKLRQQMEHPHWQTVAERCLSCGNCTSVCPSCFCSDQQDEPALDGSESVHVRQWDSCFSQGHSYIHGIVIRAETKHRYRQWLTHKLDYWHDQYGRSGCVGCGRCISWCPVAIDIRVEARKLTAEVAD